jgi:formiminotetrahydrofolate cyclodeaminase
LADTIAQDIDTIEHLLDVLRQARAVETPDEALEDDIQSAMLAAADMPLKVMRLTYDVLQLLSPVVELGNRNAAIDAAVGAHMAQAAIEGAALNIRANLLLRHTSRRSEADRALAEIAGALTANQDGPNLP